MFTSVPNTWRAPDRIGYDPTADRTVARVLPMLADERIVWLSTVRPDGTPHLVPTWFWWDGTALVVFSKPGAVKARNLRANPRLMVAVGDPEDDFSVGLIEAEATMDDGTARIPDAFFAKYAKELGPGRLDPAQFRALYTQSIRIVPTRFLAWHGRGEASAPVEVATRPTAVAGLAVRIAARLDALSARLRGTANAPLATPA
jgi:PPOX class probable F420-dependent enzyme